MQRKSRKHNQKSLDKAECLICAARKVNCRAVGCEHQFCYRCLSKWGRKKGNCPICRKDVRQVFYKNRVISPQYLQEFDQRIYLSSEENLRENEQNHLPNLSTQFEPSTIIKVYQFYYYFLPFISSSEAERNNNLS